MRSWNIEIWLLDDQGNEVMPTVYEKAVYNLHPSFDKNKQSGCPAIYSTGAHTYSSIVFAKKK